MGVLRIKEDVEELLEKDPYELFTLEGLEASRQSLPRGRSPYWVAAASGMAVAIGLACVGLFVTQRDEREATETPYAYFEIKVIDPEGHPVAGAIVKEGERQLGVTDSFGEWRRFMRAKPGSTVLLQVSKRSGQRSLMAVKNIAVPTKLPANGDLELRGSVQLAAGGTRDLAQRRPVAGGATVREPAAPLAVEAKTVGATTDTALAPPAAAEASAGPAKVLSTAEAGEAVPAASEPPGEETAKALPLDYTRVWIMSEGEATSSLAEVAQALRRRCVELGLALQPESPWRIRLRELATGESRLIQVNGTYLGGGGTEERIFSYLRGFQESSLQTAREILWATTLHVTYPHRLARQGPAWVLQPPAVRLWTLTPGRWVADQLGALHQVSAVGPEGPLSLAGGAAAQPCGPAASCEVVTPDLQRVAPVPGWQRLRLRVHSPAIAGPFDLYVSGYEARKVQDKVYEYWGAPQGQANVTAVRGGKVIHRGKVQANGTALPEISLPSPPLSRLTP